MKRKFFKALVGVLLIALTSGLFLRIGQVFNYKYYDGPSNLSAFYELPEDTVDVLNLGSSRMFMNINPAILWEDYGISSFDLCASSQPLWNTYFFLKEALKTQSPNIIVLDTYFTSMASDYSDDTTVSIKSLYQMKPSYNKLQALISSAPKEKLANLGLGLLQYHGRYQSLDENDFTDESVEYAFETNNPSRKAVWKGYTSLYTTTPFPERTDGDLDGSAACVALYPKVEEYLRKILELAQSSNIPIVLVQAPFPTAESGFPGIIAEVEQIAAEYGASFVDFDATLRNVIDCSTDFADMSHLNTSGAEKYSHALGDYLHDHYSLPDHRREHTYDSWEENAECYSANLSNHQIRSFAGDIATYLDLLSTLPESYTLIFSLDGAYSSDSYDVCAALERFGILCGESAVPGKWIVTPSGTLLSSNEGGMNDPIMTQESKADIEIVADQSGIYSDTVSYHHVQNGLNVVVYDSDNCCIADSAGFDATNGYSLVR